METWTTQAVEPDRATRRGEERDMPSPGRDTLLWTEREYPAVEYVQKLQLHEAKRKGKEDLGEDRDRWT